MISLPNASSSFKELNPEIFQSLGDKSCLTKEVALVPKGNIKRGHNPNKTEAGFGCILEARKQRGEIDEYAFEPFSLRYGAGAFYKPDWVTRKGGKVTIEELSKLCTTYIIDLAAARGRELWLTYQRLIQGRFFTMIEVKGGHIYPEAKPRFKAAKLHNEWADFELWQKKKGTWARLF